MFNYFGYGSNINIISLKAKGVEPLSSEIAVLKGWKLKFNVAHWFHHEGGVGNIEPGTPEDWVEGMLHQCRDEHLKTLDLMEAYEIGYTRIEIGVETNSGLKSAMAYVGLPNYINNTCLPTRRYMNIIIEGGKKAGLSDSYLQKLESHPLKVSKDYPNFHHPAKNGTIFTEESLKKNKYLTALCGAVFDMKNSRKNLQCLFDLFGGKDMTLFHIKRHDTSTGNETIEDYLKGNISEALKNYLNAYLNEYQNEFVYVGRYQYSPNTTQFYEEIESTYKTIET
ncbi:gamma-glutamylcyclotransferase family protein [Gillisia limnaea]|uniref:AIG2 family protein n=1 Tax=Gillisia limnaea (strain DSM 15749 / LMG 21470 / R-8282) TaxID=865937 RepID=H2BSZ2_GILLR|nr:gamma-glutamylcyclotransferase family protein [Gillisia limnaea]EHQ01522.1 AIG2 family protein [Gillisia limnaea DSM 15749]